MSFGGGDYFPVSLKLIDVQDNEWHPEQPVTGEGSAANICSTGLVNYC